MSQPTHNLSPGRVKKPLRLGLEPTGRLALDGSPFLFGIPQEPVISPLRKRPVQALQSRNIML